MSKHIALTTQSAHPWRAVIRTLLAAVIALAAMAPLIYSAITQADPEGATGAAAGALAIAGAITRVLALPVVETFLQRFVPWLAASARGDGDPANLDGYPVAEPHPATEADPERYRGE
ncbi:hypothetical protein BLJ79_21680 [Arthrobacter sp. UCD-GKA]|uniref:hypothetical protein n=1 Tax=Arthrobacter sp. UCD-GKA TaxID=1913576 RepID=UPI0008DCBCA5|nr:hypothetical protein [Arthrobacter sp. UCD-GKA]OIH81972.1 hypothetical protein BLJ79_21680 [Arthrobacter sp. UCD-GKA]